MNDAELKCILVMVDDAVGHIGWEKSTQRNCWIPSH